MRRHLIKSPIRRRFVDLTFFLANARPIVLRRAGFRSGLGTRAQLRTHELHRAPLISLLGRRAHDSKAGMGVIKKAIKPMFKRGKWNIVRGDSVKVLAGKDKGQVGTVTKVIRDTRIPRVLVDGLNLVRPLGC